MTPDEFHKLLETLAQTPAALRGLLNGMDSAALTFKPGAQEFSALENVCHLRDIEAQGYTVRIEKLLAGGEPFLPDLDGARLALEGNYNEQDLETALRTFAFERESNLRRIRELSPDQLSCRGVMENVGQITLERLLLLMKEHDRSHLQELRALQSLWRGPLNGEES